jgi:hypothetical protein
MNYFLRFPVFLSITAMLAGTGCQPADHKDQKADSLATRKNIPPSPVLSPEESLKKMHLEKGFSVSLIAAEPLVTAPVAVNFDNLGRLWVVEKIYLVGKL